MIVFNVYFPIFLSSSIFIILMPITSHFSTSDFSRMDFESLTLISLIVIHVSTNSIPISTFREEDVAPSGTNRKIH